MIALLLRAGARALTLAAFVLAYGAPPVAVAAATAPVILVVGDSISAAYGIEIQSGWVQLLARRLKAQHYTYDIVNASISGDTTAGGRSRLPPLLKQHRPAVVVIELGGNDGLRGGDLTAMRQNIDAMISASQKAGARVLLVGMRMPPNYGNSYTRAFENVYTQAAREHDVPLVPFLFEGFAETAEWFQADRVHPTAAAQPRLLENVWPALKPLLGKGR